MGIAAGKQEGMQALGAAGAFLLALIVSGVVLFFGPFVCFLETSLGRSCRIPVIATIVGIVPLILMAIFRKR
jgi:hypothetical protein